MQNILVVEDDIDIQEILNNYLTDAGYKVIIASDGVAGIAKFNSEIDLVLLEILLCKIAAILRRGLQDNIDKDIIIYKDLRMDIEGFHLYCKEQEVILTQKEFDLLRLLLENQGRVFTRQMLLDRLWDFDTYVEDRIVDSHIKNLRKKLNVDYIETIRGVGYRIDKSN